MRCVLNAVMDDGCRLSTTDQPGLLAYVVASVSAWNVIPETARRTKEEAEEALEAWGDANGLSRKEEVVEHEDS